MPKISKKKLGYLEAIINDDRLGADSLRILIKFWLRSDNNLELVLTDEEQAAVE